MSELTRAIALGFSNRELLRHWEMFGTYPTNDRRQMERMDALLNGEWPDEKPLGPLPEGMPEPRVTPARVRRDWDAMEKFVKKSGRPGEQHYMAKITDDDVREMRKWWAEGMPLCRIADAKHVSRHVARRVCLRQAWKHVA